MCTFTLSFQLLSGLPLIFGPLALLKCALAPSLLSILAVARPFHSLPFHPFHYSTCTFSYATSLIYTFIALATPYSHLSFIFLDLNCIMIWPIKYPSHQLSIQHMPFQVLIHCHPVIILPCSPLSSLLLWQTIYFSLILLLSCFLWCKKNYWNRMLWYSASQLFSFREANERHGSFVCSKVKDRMKCCHLLWFSLEGPPFSVQ